MEKTCTRELECELTDDELLKYGEELAAELKGITELEVERAKLNAKIKPKKERVEHLAIAIDRKKEVRTIECKWEYYFDLGTRVLHRTDTWEMVHDDIIPEHIRQMHFRDFDHQTPGGCDESGSVNENQEECSHPVESRIHESNALICGVCKAVLKAAPIERESQPAKEDKRAKK